MASNFRERAGTSPQCGRAQTRKCVDLSKRWAELTLNDTRSMVIQPYIEHSENGYPTEYRVLTLFGRALLVYCNGIRRFRLVRRPA